MTNSLVARLAILALSPPVLARQAGDPVPWVAVDSYSESAENRIDGIDLVVLDEAHLLGCYQVRGHFRASNRGTWVVRSADGGRTWSRVQSWPDLSDATLAWDGSRAWLVGTGGGGPVVLGCADPRTAAFGEAVRLRGDDRLKGVPTSIVHGGRIWRAFRRELSIDCAQVTPQVLVGSASLGADLRDPDVWRWSAERAAQCIDAVSFGSPMRFVAAPDGRLFLTAESAQQATPLSVLEVSPDGWTLTKVATSPAWKNLPASADRFEPAGGWYRCVGHESSAGRSSNALTLVRTPDLETWQSLVLLHDTREVPMRFEDAAARRAGDDLVILFAWRTDLSRNYHGESTGPSSLSFLRVSNPADRKTSNPPLWGPPLPR